MGVSSVNKNNADYGVEQITTLEGMKAIRLRAGMYIGSVGPEGVRHITLEIISNNETMWVREVKLRNRIIVLRKSRVPITKDNVNAYIILELFNNIDLKKFFEDELVKKEVIEFVKKSGIKCKDLYSLAGAFPSKATKNITESGIINELT